MKENRLSKIRGFSYRYYFKELLLVSLFFGFVFGYYQIEALMKRVWVDFKPTFEWELLYKLAFDYTVIVLIASFLSFIIAFSIGVLMHVYKCNALKVGMKSLVDFGVTFPTIALIAILVPLMGYGFKPVLLALIIYGLMPILINTLKGLEAVDKSLVTSAYGMGMSRWQCFIYVELPLGMPLILAGIRTSIIINISAASVGAVVGAGGLGMPIISGIRTNQPILILKGAIPITLMALLTDRIFYRLERKYKW